MKLADIYLTVNGHLLGPFVTVLPQDVRGADLVPAEGDAVQVVISPRVGGRKVQTVAQTTLRKS